MKRDFKTPVRTRRHYSALPRNYFDLSTEINDAMKRIQWNLNSIRAAQRWSFNIETNKVFARMCAADIISLALELNKGFEHAGIGYRDGIPLILNPPTRTLS